MASPGHLGKTIPEVQVLLLHFVFSDRSDVNLAALTDPELTARWAPLFREKNLELLSFLQEGWMVWTTREPVRSPSDFEGVKIRTMTSPLLLATYAAYGASPQAMPYGEVYSALQLNMIDAQVNPVFAIEEMSFYEVTDCMTFARPAPFLTTAVANAEFLERLDPDRRELVLEVVDELQPLLFELQERVNEERLEAIRERKPEMTMIRLDEPQRDAFRRQSLPLREQCVDMVGQRGRELLTVLLKSIERAENAPASARQRDSSTRE